MNGPVVPVSEHFLVLPSTPRAPVIEIQCVANLPPLPGDDLPHQQEMTEAGAVTVSPPLTAF